ncbi:heme o synthase [Archaeoglobus neptunius]|uniref:heme o synthase n=1 Tax=Archaeoglobus neptunius TaxID=2798580 RepID=UPI001926AB75
MPKAKALIEITKPKQTLLLMVTFIVSYLVGSGVIDFRFAEAFFSMYLAISGTTAINMWLDRDIDALMLRTKNRPLPSGSLSTVECAVYGSFLFALGFAIGLKVSLEFAFIVFMGLFFDIVIYTVLLKRKSPYSIVLGGFAGAMPALGGWVAVQGFTLPGFIIAAIVLLWIPSHIWYISMHYEDDYRTANIPMYPLVVGMEKASWAIVGATAVMLLLASSLYILLPLSIFYLLLSVSAVSFFLYKAVKFALSPDRFKAKKMYKLASMTLGLVYISLLLGVFL